MCFFEIGDDLIMVKYFITVFVLTCLWFLFGLFYIGESSFQYYYEEKEAKKYATVLSVFTLVGNCLAILSGIIFFRNIFPQYLFAIITCNLVLFLVWFIYGMMKKKPWDLLSAVFGNIPFEVAALTGYFAAAGYLLLMRICIAVCFFLAFLSLFENFIKKKSFGGEPTPTWIRSLIHILVLLGISFLPIAVFRIILVVFLGFHLWNLFPYFHECILRFHSDFDEYYAMKPMIFVTLIELILVITI